ncbi:CDP-glycerol glycerophosphotransferase family protein [Mesobacillus maritimus]|uniref:CDP-glycerol glycerophosphotransferase family protein n=1 Tax=Mesobacillus maritimus TaxID=1643336 RepID=UPI00203C2F79|nr:CDP-glycerol glycerophosphotransferase family protein [Mesobacillus maritimus]MCM3668083.1 CDP-glycerol glycerophosphotransferase family protein [Mesobacillus maritimus]
MSESAISNKLIRAITFNQNKLFIEFYFLQDLMEENNVVFSFMQRGTDHTIHFPITPIDEVGDFDVYQAVIDLDTCKQEFEQVGTWDLYITMMTEEEEEKNFRLKSNKEELELLFYLFEEQGRIFFPYTTNKGNASFRTRNAGVVAKIEQVTLDKGQLQVAGYAHYSKWSEMPPSSIKKTLIVRNNVTEDIVRIDLPNVDRPDLTEKYGQGRNNFDLAGFETTLNLKDFAFHSEVFLKLYVELTFPENGEQVTVESGRLKYQTFNNRYSFQKGIFNIKGSSKKVRIKSTKKSKYLSIRIADYSLIREAKGKVRRAIQRIRGSKKIKKVYKLAFKFLGMLPADKKLVVFESFLGKQYSDNPRAIYEYLKENHPEYKLYWSADKKYLRNFKDKDINFVPRFTIQWLFIMARAKFWVSNSRLPLWIPKPNHTVYLQTWHGTPLKRLAADMEEVHMPGTNTVKYKKNFLKEASNWDYLISPNSYSTEIFRRAFQFDRTMIESGYPRNDYLYQANNQETIAALKERFGIPEDKKVILYAPTWRDDQFYGKGKYKFDLELDLYKLREELGDEYVIILRMHYLVAENFDLGPHVGFAYDFSNYEDIRELYLVSDLLITDYSSVFFDYANLRRPMIFFVYDIDNYRDKLRGFYFDFEEQAPGPLTKTTEEVIEHIKQVDSNPVLNPKFDAFVQRFCSWEKGESSKKVVEEVFLKQR